MSAPASFKLRHPPAMGPNDNQTTTSCTQTGANQLGSQCRSRDTQETPVGGSEDKQQSKSVTTTTGGRRLDVFGRQLLAALSERRQSTKLTRRRPVKTKGNPLCDQTNAAPATTSDITGDCRSRESLSLESSGGGTSVITTNATMRKCLASRRLSDSSGTRAGQRVALTQLGTPRQLIRMLAEQPSNESLPGTANTDTTTGSTTTCSELGAASIGGSNAGLMNFLVGMPTRAATCMTDANNATVGGQRQSVAATGAAGGPECWLGGPASRGSGQMIQQANSKRQAGSQSAGSTTRPVPVPATTAPNESRKLSKQNTDQMGKLISCLNEFMNERNQNAGPNANSQRDSSDNPIDCCDGPTLDEPQLEPDETLDLDQSWTSFVVHLQPPVPPNATNHLLQNREEVSSKQQLASLRAQQDAIWELISTEATYIKRLQVVANLFLATLNRLKQRSLLQDIDPCLVASNITQVISANLTLWSQFFKPTLDRARSNGQPMEPLQFRDAFLAISSLFRPYYRYCIEQGFCTNYIREQKDTNEQFKVYLAWCESQKECERLRLADLLAYPMQRLTRYSLLLKQIARRTDDHRQQVGLVQMIAYMNKFVLTVDLELKRQNELNKLLRISRRLETTDMLGIESFNSEVQHLIRSNYQQFDLMEPLFSQDHCHFRCARQLLFDSSQGTSTSTSTNTKASALQPFSQLKFKDPFSSNKLDVILLIFTDQLFICKQATSGQNSNNLKRPSAFGHTLNKTQPSSRENCIYKDDLHQTIPFGGHLRRPFSLEIQQQRQLPSASPSSSAALNYSNSEEITSVSTAKQHQHNRFSNVSPLTKQTVNLLSPFRVRSRLASDDQTSALIGSSNIQKHLSADNSRSSIGNLTNPARSVSKQSSNSSLFSCYSNQQPHYSQQHLFHYHLAPNQAHSNQSSGHQSTSNLDLQHLIDFSEQVAISPHSSPMASSSNKKALGKSLRAIRPPYPIDRLVMHELNDGLSVLVCQLNDSNTVVASFVLYFPKQRVQSEHKSCTLFNSPESKHCQDMKDAAPTSISLDDNQLEQQQRASANQSEWDHYHQHHQPATVRLIHEIQQAQIRFQIIANLHGIQMHNQQSLFTNYNPLLLSSATLDHRSQSPSSQTIKKINLSSSLDAYQRAASGHSHLQHNLSGDNFELRPREHPNTRRSVSSDCQTIYTATSEANTVIDGQLGKCSPNRQSSNLQLANNNKYDVFRSSKLLNAVIEEHQIVLLNHGKHDFLATNDFQYELGNEDENWLSVTPIPIAPLNELVSGAGCKGSRFDLQCSYQDDELDSTDDLQPNQRAPTMVLNDCDSFVPCHGPVSRPQISRSARVYDNQQNIDIDQHHPVGSRAVTMDQSMTDTGTVDNNTATTNTYQDTSVPDSQSNSFSLSSGPQSLLFDQSGPTSFELHQKTGALQCIRTSSNSGNWQVFEWDVAKVGPEIGEQAVPVAYNNNDNNNMQPDSGSTLSRGPTDKATRLSQGTLLLDGTTTTKLVCGVGQHKLDLPLAPLVPPTTPENPPSRTIQSSRPHLSSLRRQNVILSASSEQSSMMNSKQTRLNHVNALASNDNYKTVSIISANSTEFAYNKESNGLAAVVEPIEFTKQQPNNVNNANNSDQPRGVLAGASTKFRAGPIPKSLARWSNFCQLQSIDQDRNCSMQAPALISVTLTAPKGDDPQQPEQIEQSDLENDSRFNADTNDLAELEVQAIDASEQNMLDATETKYLNIPNTISSPRPKRTNKRLTKQSRESSSLCSDSCHSSMNDDQSNQTATISSSNDDEAMLETSLSGASSIRHDSLEHLIALNRSFSSHYHLNWYQQSSCRLRGKQLKRYPTGSDDNLSVAYSKNDVTRWPASSSRSVDEKSATRRSLGKLSRSVNELPNTIMFPEECVLVRANKWARGVMMEPPLGPTSRSSKWDNSKKDIPQVGVAVIGSSPGDRGNNNCNYNATDLRPQNKGARARRDSPTIYGAGKWSARHWRHHRAPTELLTKWTGSASRLAREGWALAANSASFRNDHSHGVRLLSERINGVVRFMSGLLDAKNRETSDKNL